MSMNTVILNEKKKKKQVKQKEKGAAEDEMVIEHHWLNGHEFEHVSRRQWRTEQTGGLESVGSKELDMT